MRRVRNLQSSLGLAGSSSGGCQAFLTPPLNPSTIQCLIHEDGALRAATHTRAASGIKDSRVVTRTTVDGQAWATPRGVQIDTAVVTMTVDGVYGTTEVRFAPPYAVSLPLVPRNH
jgi:hypothetical protein